MIEGAVDFTTGRDSTLLLELLLLLENITSCPDKVHRVFGSTLVQNFIMQMSARAAACIAQQTDHLMKIHLVALFHEELVKVGVAGRQARAVIDFD
jgi:hypothetical protein